MIERDDIQQNAMLRRLRSGSPIERGRKYTRRELYTGKEFGVACYHARIDAYRNHRRDQKCAEAALERYTTDHRRHLRGPDCNDPAERCAIIEQVQLLRNNVRELPAREREIVEQCSLGGHVLRDFAAAHGYTERAAESLLYRAKARLREQMNPNGDRRHWR